MLNFLFGTPTVFARIRRSWTGCLGSALEEAKKKNKSPLNNQQPGTFKTRSDFQNQIFQASQNRFFLLFVSTEAFIGPVQPLEVN